MSTESPPVSPDAVAEAEVANADLKIILLGDSAVGKSKLVERYLMSNYRPIQLSTYALTVFRSVSNINGKEVLIDFWDTAGQERFASLHPSYFYRAHACLLVFDLTRKTTYQNLTQWYNELQQYRKGIPILVVANKVDMNPKAATKSFAFTEKYGLPPVRFCSAADGTNVVQTFEEIISIAYEHKFGRGVSSSTGESTKSPAATTGGAGSDDTYLDDIMEVLEYFETKEGHEAKDDDAAGGSR